MPTTKNRYILFIALKNYKRKQQYWAHCVKKTKTFKMNTFLRHQKKLIKCDYVLQLADKRNKSCTTYYRSQLARKYGFDGRTHVQSVYKHNSPLLTQHAAALYAATGNDEFSYMPLHSYMAIREFRLGSRLYDNPSSKVEQTVQKMKDKQKEKVEEIIKEAAANDIAAKASSIAASASASAVTTETTATAAAMKPATGKAAVVKKPLGTRIWEEVVHYYNGFRLLFIDINICRKLLWRVLNGKTLTRRENKLLLRTTSDLFRLIPFSVFIIVPFMELLLPVFIKFFPGMLPSTFQTAKERENKLKHSLQVRLEMARFLQETLDVMAVEHRESKEQQSEEAAQFSDFFKRIKNPSEYVPPDEIIKFAKRFEDEITVDLLSREQLSALCRVLELNTMGTTNFLRFQLRVKLRSLAADDRVISREGVNGLDLFELQQACKARGMRAYGLTSDRLRAQLQEWIDLSLNEKVPPTLLLLSRALHISDETTTSDKLKETIRVLPDSIAAKTKDAIAESEGKIDIKAKIDIIKEEERKIKEEREEAREEALAKAEEEKAKAEMLVDKAPIITTDANAFVASSSSKTPLKSKSKPVDVPIAEEGISSKDVSLLSQALKSLSSDKELVVEKGMIKDLKEELKDYKEDVEELREVRSVVNHDVHETRAAKMLFKKVDSMIGKLDKVLNEIEQKHKAIKTTETKEDIAAKRKEEELVRIDELVHTIKKLVETSDEPRLKQIEKVLSTIDADKDGIITVEEVLNVVEALGRENVNLSEKQIEEVVALLDKEHWIETEEKIEKAIAKGIKEAKVQEAKQQEVFNKMEDLHEAEMAVERSVDRKDELKDRAPEIKDNAVDLNLSDKKNVLKTESNFGTPASTLTTTTESTILEQAAEKQKEKILPSADISAAMPPPPPPTTTATQNDDGSKSDKGNNNNDKKNTRKILTITANKNSNTTADARIRGSRMNRPTIKKSKVGERNETSGDINDKDNN